MSLKKKTIDGLVWSGFSQGGKVLSQFIVTAILSRLLSPDDFGLLAMATVFTNFALIFGEMGMGSALIQKQDVHDDHYHSAFWLNVAAGIGLTLLLTAAAPIIARFYGNPKLTAILATLSLNFIITSLTIVQQSILMKDMDFKKLAFRDMGALLISGIAGIALAYRGFGVWSLVYQSLILSSSNALFLWIYSSWRPKFKFSSADIKEIFNFSASLTGFNVINYFARNLDQLLIGKFLGSQAIGYYSMAYRIMLYPLQNISQVIGRVMFPAFSQIQGDVERVRRTYLRMVQAISLVTFPLMLGLFALAPEFVSLFLGPRWDALTPLVRILCFCGMAQSIGTTVGNILLSQGRANLQFKMQIFGTILTAASIIVGLQWGVRGVAFCYTAQSILWVHVTFFFTFKLIDLKYREFYGFMIPAYLMSIAMAALIFLLKPLARVGGFPGMALWIFCGAAAYGTMLFLVKKNYLKELVAANH